MKQIPLKQARKILWAVTVAIAVQVVLLAVLPSRWDRALFVLVTASLVVMAVLSLTLLRCPHCGGQLHLWGQKFCPTCGKPVEE